MQPSFHLSLGVRSVDASVDFFARILGARVTHRDPSGYVNVDLFGSQITLKQNDDIDPRLPDLHFGVNLGLDEFERVAARVLESGRDRIVAQPQVVDAGTPLERRKMYLRCPTGYLIEIKGYRTTH